MMSSLARNWIAQAAMACVLVLLVALVLLAADADLAVAEIVLMLAVVGRVGPRIPGRARGRHRGVRAPELSVRAAERVVHRSTTPTT